MTEQITDLYVDQKGCGENPRLVIRVGETSCSMYFTGTEGNKAVADKLRQLANLVEAVK